MKPMSKGKLRGLCRDFDNKYRMQDTQACHKILDAFPFSDINLLEAPICRAIMHDRLREPHEAKRILEQFVHEKGTSPILLKAMVALTHKLNMHRECVELAQSLEKIGTCSVPTSTLVDARIKKAYSLEALREFRGAIEEFDIIRSQYDRDLRRSGLIADVFHGLGHCHTELGLAEGSCFNLREGRRWMSEAVERDARYFACLGTIHSEARDYPTAVKILDLARSRADIIKNEHLLNEIRFYLGDAMSWLSLEDEAREFFELFRGYAIENGNTDAECHCIYYDVMLELRTKGIHELSRFDLLNLQVRLKQVEPSDYMPESFRIAWKQVQVIVDFMLQVHELYNNPRLFLRSGERLPAAVQTLDRADVQARVGVLGIESKHTASSVIFSNIDDLAINYGSDDIELLNQITVLIMAESQKGLPADQILKKMGTDHVIFEHYTSNDQYLQCELHRERIKSRGPMEVLCHLAGVIALLDEIRKRIARPVFLFGMVPTIEAPTFATQAGDIEFPLGR